MSHTIASASLDNTVKYLLYVNAISCLQKQPFYLEAVGDSWDQSSHLELPMTSSMQPLLSRSICGNASHVSDWRFLCAMAGINPIKHIMPLSSAAWEREIYQTYPTYQIPVISLSKGAELILYTTYTPHQTSRNEGNSTPVLCYDYLRTIRGIILSENLVDFIYPELLEVDQSTLSDVTIASRRNERVKPDWLKTVAWTCSLIGTPRISVPNAEYLTTSTIWLK